LAQSNQKAAEIASQQGKSEHIENNNMVQTQGQAGGRVKVHVAQLVSEVADASADNKDDLKLQVPLNSRNDAVYLGTVWMGSPIS
jgi:pyrrolidone-carboxylate peptidase